jgi:hypothetical protein
MSTETPTKPARGLHQHYTNIVRTALARIADDAVNAQCALSPDELAKLDPMEAAQLLCDAHRALNNTRVASQAVSAAIKKAIGR